MSDEQRTGHDAVWEDYCKTIPLLSDFASLPNLEDRVRAMADDRKRLQAIVDRLPKTADGVPIVPGYTVYMQWTGHERRVRAIHRDSIAVTVGCIAATLVNVHPHQCYSTREAAEKARKA